jgi:hypothetical protein
MMGTMTGKLELKDEGRDGLRHYLNGEPVHAGELLEAQLDDGAWILGRYEWSFSKDEPPHLHVTGGSLALVTMLVRWPERNA